MTTTLKVKRNHFDPNAPYQAYTADGAPVAVVNYSPRRNPPIDVHATRQRGARYLITGNRSILELTTDPTGSLLVGSLGPNPNLPQWAVRMELVD